jgi:hypothetical protein
MNKISFLMVLLLGGSICACSLARQPAKEYPPIDQLLIDESAFPEGWEAGEPDWEHPPRAPWSGRTRMVEYIERDFQSLSGTRASARIVIQQFDNPQSAAKDYERELAIWFRDEEWRTPWAIPDSLEFESPQADQYRYGCSADHGQPECAFLAQYEVYNVRFTIRYFSIEAIAYTELLPVFQAIDKRATFALNSE